MKVAPWRHWSNWRSVRIWEAGTRQQLRRKHLWLHGWCIGALVVVAMWGASHLQMVLGSDSLAVRYLVTLGVGYGMYLLVVRWWAGMLAGEREGTPDPGDLAEVADVALDAALDGPRGGSDVRSGEGGDFGGGGASGEFDGPGASGDIDAAHAAVDLGDAADASSVGSDLASGVLEAAGGADEGAIVVIPVLAVFGAVCLVLFGAGSLLLLYFGAEVLLTVAVEVAFGYVTARTAVKVAREGWLSAAVRLTWKPLLGALLAAVAVGAALDHFVPEARSLPQAVRLLRAG